MTDSKKDNVPLGVSPTTIDDNMIDLKNNFSRVLILGRQWNAKS